MAQAYVRGRGVCRARVRARAGGWARARVRG